MAPEATVKLPSVQHVWAGEQRHYSLGALQGLLGVRETEATRKAVQQLCDAKLLRTQRKGKPQTVFGEDDNETSDAWDSRHLERYDYSFRCVGLLQFRKRVLYILPKYCTDWQDTAEKARLSTLSTLLQVITRYRRDTRSLGEEESDEEHPDFLHTMVELVTDYASNGPYRADEAINEINGRGRILWARTIRRVLPLMQGERPYYTDLHTRRRQTDTAYFITRLHQYLVWQARKNLEAIHLAALLGIPDMTEAPDHEEEFSDTEYLIHCIRQEQALRFDNRRRYLLALMLRYLQAREEQTTDGIYLYGKSDFHVVWEEACRKALGMAASEREQMLPSVPRWKTESGRVAFGSELKADMFCYQNGTLLIGDAKYYIPRMQDFRNGNASGMPGIGDIIKQQLYELALRHHYGADIKTRNVFLMPLLDDEKKEDTGLITRFGSVSIPMLTEGTPAPPPLRGFCALQPILLCKVDPDAIWQAYLNRETLFAKFRDSLT